MIEEMKDGGCNCFIYLFVFNHLLVILFYFDLTLLNDVAVPPLWRRGGPSSGRGFPSIDSQ